jgi:hypothetical protein
MFADLQNDWFQEMTQRDNRQWKNDETRTGIKGTWQKIW